MLLIVTYTGGANLHPVSSGSLCIHFQNEKFAGSCNHETTPPFQSFQVAGERYVYKFVCEPEALISLAFPDNQRPSLKAEFERYVNEEDTVPLSHLDEGVSYTTEQAPQNLGPQPYSKGYMY